VEQSILVLSGRGEGMDQRVLVPMGPDLGNRRGWSRESLFPRDQTYETGGGEQRVLIPKGPGLIEAGVEQRVLVTKGLL
jgi:hypothetical protein